MSSSSLKARTSLLRWFSKNRRELPWRPSDLTSSRDPYTVLVSEVMLQQTQVAVVTPRFIEWMKALSTVAALAKATPEEVAQLWSGLGYYARARHLHKGAAWITQQHNGLFPQTRKELEEIPGIGPYSAGAILSLAFQKREAIVDGNIFRIFARLYGWDVPTGDAAKMRESWEIARCWADHRTPHLVNESLMELGALVCTPRNPKCEECPLRSACLSLSEGKATERPTPKQRKKSLSVERTWLLLPLSKGNYLLQPPGIDRNRLLPHHWQIPSLEGHLSIEKIAAFFKLPRHFIQMGGEIKHTITHHRISGRVAIIETTDAVQREMPELLPQRKSILQHALAKKIFEAAAALQKNRR